MIGKLYWLASYHSLRAKREFNIFTFNVDEQFRYFPILSDFGPSNIADVWNYVVEMIKIMKNEKYANATVVHHTDRTNIKRANSAFLMGCFEMLSLKRTADEVIERWKHIKFIPYKDASYNPSYYKCYVRMLS